MSTLPTQQHAASWENLVGAPVQSMRFLGGGRNSRVWCTTDSNGQQYLAKEYFCSPHDPRERLKTEWRAVNFLHQHGIHCVPEALACDLAAGRAVYSFVEGESPAPYGHGRAEMQPLVKMICQLYDLRQAGLQADVAPASAACFSLQEILDHLERRCRLLQDAACKQAVLDPGPEKEIYCALKDFVDTKLLPALHSQAQIARQVLARSGVLPKAVLPPALRIPSPSDFGFHNAIRRPDGTLCFVDFEYFGMDDPARLLADVCLHPGMQLTKAQKVYFVEQVLQYIKPWDAALESRFQAGVPLWKLQWCAILLNEFLPQEKARRVFSLGEQVQEWTQQQPALQPQLAKACALMEMPL